MAAGVKIIWTLAEEKFLTENFFNLSNEQLCAGINLIRNTSVKISAVRSKCKELGLTHGIQIRWHKADIQFVVDNFRQYGDYELAILLNQNNNTFRLINGIKVYRFFSKKHVEKKRELLGLYRTPEEIKAIVSRNKKLGFQHAWTKENNAYTLGIKPVSPEGETRTWRTNGKKQVFVKKNGRFTTQARHVWEQRNGPIPKGYNIIHKDRNPLNDNIENLSCIDNAELVNHNLGYRDLTDSYIVTRMTYNHPELRPVLLAMPEIIELNRNKIILKRTINELIKTSKVDR